MTASLEATIPGDAVAATQDRPFSDTVLRQREEIPALYGGVDFSGLPERFDKDAALAWVEENFSAEAGFEAQEKSGADFVNRRS